MLIEPTSEVLQHRTADRNRLIRVETRFLLENRPLFQVRGFDLRLKFLIANVVLVFIPSGCL